MKNRCTKIILISLLLLVAALFFAACDEVEEIVSESGNLAFYEGKDGSYTVYSVAVGSSTHHTEITVPETYLGTKVAGIVENGFANLPNLKKIILPESITTIPAGAFAGSKNLETIVIGEKIIDVSSVYSINGKVFGNTEGLQIADGALVGTKFMELSFADSHDKAALVDLSASNIIPEITKISVTPKLNDITDMYETTELSVLADHLDAKVNFGTYGLFKNVDVKLYKDDTLFAEHTFEGVKVTASHYNFAYLNATYPVLVASLKLNEITENGTVPTFVALERNASYNWDNLPYNMSALPFLTREAATTGGFFERRAATAEYIKELYELNPYSKFSLYVVDNYPELILEFLIANGIPETNWNAVMLSDGSGTAYYLSETFGVDDPAAKYETMKSEWHALKQYFYEKGSFNLDEDTQYIYDNISEKGKEVKASILVKYPYIIAKEQDNVTWWVNRLRAGENLSAINEKDPEFTQDIIANTTAFYTNNLLAALSPEEVTAFKNLYNFNSEMFSVAEEQGKKVMVILGTSWVYEKDNFYKYMKLTMKYYGDDYVYYYKGHPGYPTSLYEDRADALERLKNEGYTLYELDNAIAAEVILFFYPGIYSSGWASSTFDSLEDHTRAGILFDVGLSNTHTYKDMMEAYANDIESSAYGNIALDANKQYCLLEFNDTKEYAEKIDAYSKHEIAIYNVTDDEIKYYKSTGDNTWKEVDVEGNNI